MALDWSKDNMAVPTGFSSPAIAPQRTTWRETISWQVVIWFVLLALFLSMESWIFGPYSYLPLHDAGDGQVPTFYTLARSVLEHGYSYWYPYHLAGVDERSTYSLWHLITPFFMFLPIWLAYASVLFLQHLLGGLSMYAFCRIRFRMSKLASAIAGVAYTSPIIIMFGAEAHQTWWMNNYFEYRLAWGFAIPALPFFCLALDYANERASLLRAGLIGLAIGVVLVLAMFFIAFWPYTLVVLGIYAVTMGRGRIVSRIVVLFAVAAASALPQIDHLYAASYLYPESHRAIMDMSAAAVGKHQYTGGSWPDLTKLIIQIAKDMPYHIVFFVWRFFFIVFPIQITATVVIFLTTLGFANYRAQYGREMLAIFLGFIAFAGLILMAGPLKVIFQKLSGIFSRIDFNYAWGCGVKFFIIVAYGYALHIVSKWHGTRWVTTCRVGILLTMAVIPIVYANSTYKAASILHWAQNGSSFANYDSPQLRQLKELAGESGPYRVASITGYSVPLSLYPNFVNPLGLESFDAYENLFPQRYGRFFLTAIGPEKEQYLDKFIHGFIGKQLDDQYVVSSLVYIIYVSGGAARMVNLDLLGLANVRYILSPVILNDPRLKLVLKPEEAATNMSALPPVARTLHESILPPLRKVFSRSNNATYLINLVDQMIPINFGGRQVYIYENTLVLPRAFVPAKADVHSPDGVWVALLGRSVKKLTSEAIVEKPIVLPTAPSTRTAGKTVAPSFLHYKPGSYEVEGATPKPALLVITNSYSKYWKAEVNGKPAEAVPAYGAFTAVPIPAGHFNVKMRYESPTLLSRLGAGH